MPDPFTTGPKSTAIASMSRRAWLVGGGSLAVLAGLWWMQDDAVHAGPFEVEKSDLADLPSITDLVAGRKERFLVFCDDLTFHGAEEGYMRSRWRSTVRSRPPPTTC